MIVVIADDLSGAAELAGAAAERGISAEVQTAFDPASGADVIALDTNTRSKSAHDAAKLLAIAATEILRAKPEWVYKKTDSVLRGNVLTEIETLLRIAGLRRALLIPANPGKGRTICSGLYHINGTPLHQTLFASDPEHPRNTGDVVELLLGSANEHQAHVMSVRGDDPIPAEGVVVPDIETSADVARRVGDVDTSTLPAGGVEFFVQLLELKGMGKANLPIDAPRNQNDTHGTSPSHAGKNLFVCGSAQAWQDGRQRQCTRSSIPVLTMPDELYQGSSSSPERAVGDWESAIISTLNAHGCAMATIGRDTISSAVGSAIVTPAMLTDFLASAVGGVLGRTSVDLIFVEGGATAAALIAKMGWLRLAALWSSRFPRVATLQPIPSGAQGILAGRNGPILLIKPGSYPWPEEVWPVTDARPRHLSFERLSN